MSSQGLKVTFLGTGTSMGVPVIGCDCPACASSNKKDTRLRTSILVQQGDLNIVIDSGPDFRYQMLRSGIRHLDALVFTHEHKDHTAGMDDVRAFNFIQRKPVSIFATERVEEALRKEFHYAFAAIKYPGVPEVEFTRIEQEIFDVAGIPFQPIDVMHHKLPVKAFRIGDFSYVTDANYISESEKAKIRGSKVLVLNALRRTSHISHFTLDEAIELSDELEVETTYFTHMSHQLEPHDEVQASLPAGKFLAYDQLTIEI